jgi:DNA-binding MarR family transcriptional regulator
MPSPRTLGATHRRTRVGAAEIDAVLAACRVLVTASAQSIAAVEDVADLTQVRALVVLSSRGPLSLSELADAAALHITRASRICDRLVAADLIERGDDPDNRRQLVLTLTSAGAHVVRTVVRRRRAAVEPALARLSVTRRAELVSVLEEFAAAGGGVAESDLWALGWAT